ncbi:hypothetical protein TCAL_17091 [Tigriopus californicus]|uniref:Uncharacterized protein n=1 Tax=Tigriopus californicus TaxID=6832 RepID=A0A553PQY9_TIGCA|nr:uncharacterized protein LOC131882076 [Tigriopus californicus]TRY80092.1 hypothetical protein TCAL_17091 [Tigriopus californicus]
MEDFPLRRRPGLHRSPSLKSLQEQDKFLNFTDLTEPQDHHDHHDDDLKKPDEGDTKARNPPILETKHQDTMEDVDEELEVAPDYDQWTPRPRMNAFVGFLRLSNYACSCLVIFGVAVSIFYPYSQDRPVDDELEFWQDFTYDGCQWIQMICLVIVAVLIAVDSVATFTFRWKEYGELTYTQTDATSIIFLLCPSRWIFRGVCSLMMSSAISLRAARVMQAEELSPHDYAWYYGSTLMALGSTLVGFIFSLFPWHCVPWLLDRFEYAHVEDKDDVWIRFNAQGRVHPPLKHPDVEDGSPASLNGIKFHETQNKTRVRRPSAPPLSFDEQMWKSTRDIVSGVCNVMIFATFGISLMSQIYAFFSALDKREGLEFWINISTWITNLLLILCAILYLFFYVGWRCHLSHHVPLLIKFLAPFCLSNAALAVFNVSAESELPRYYKVIMSYIWIYSIGIMVILVILEQSFIIGPYSKTMTSFRRIVRLNCYEEGVNKKLIRVFDTSGSLSALVALVLGITSLFIDQYDLNFEPEGAAKELARVANEFRDTTRTVTSVLDQLIKTLDRQFDCKEVFTVLGTGATLTLFASFFPGAGGVASLGSRSAYYGVRTANAFTNLARRLRKSKNIIWQVSKAVYVVQKFTLSNMKNLIKLNSYGTLVKLLPFLPPVVLGMYVLFSAFWPQRVLFFSAKQRRKTMAGMFYTWLLGLILLIVAITVNTYVVDEVVLLISDMIPIGAIHVERKLGWNLGMAASAFSLLSVVSFLISSFILKWQTHTNHENISNAELEWKEELEKREMVTIHTGIGEKYEKRTQIKYKKERLGPWNWMVPIMLCLISFGFGCLGNIYPKLRYEIEPKGKFGRLIDRLNDQMNFYQNDMHDVKNDTSMECLPYATFHAVLDEYGYKNPLMSPVHRFFNETEKLVKPLKDVLKGVRKQLLMNVQEELFGTTIKEFWQDANLELFSWIFLVPRLICLLILIFGLLTSSLYVCQMRIIQSLEPRKIVKAYGHVAMFSLIYVLGTEFAIYNLISTFGIPFYHITLRFGLGFIYDLVADFILISVYFGMSNQLFFAIPKRKVMVTYSVPGASDLGPNRPGQII